MKDIMDGYFPSELQSRYPDGIPFEVHNRAAKETYIQLVSQRGSHWGLFPILESLDTSKSDFISAVLSLMIEILLILKFPWQ